MACKQANLHKLSMNIEPYTFANSSVATHPTHQVLLYLENFDIKLLQINSYKLLFQIVLLIGLKLLSLCHGEIGQIFAFHNPFFQKFSHIHSLARIIVHVYNNHQLQDYNFILTVRSLS